MLKQPEHAFWWKTTEEESRQKRFRRSRRLFIWLTNPEAKKQAGSGWGLHADPGDLSGRTVRRKNEKGKKKNLTKDRMDRNDPDGCRISDRLYGNIGR